MTFAFDFNWFEAGEIFLSLVKIWLCFANLIFYCDGTFLLNVFGTDCRPGDLSGMFSTVTPTG